MNEIHRKKKKLEKSFQKILVCISCKISLGYEFIFTACIKHSLTTEQFWFQSVHKRPALIMFNFPQGKQTKPFLSHEVWMFTSWRWWKAAWRSCSCWLCSPVSFCRACPSVWSGWRKAAMRKSWCWHGNPHPTYRFGFGEEPGPEAREKYKIGATQCTKW